MPIKRGARPGDPVVVVLRAAAQDERLSYKARGILLAVMSRPDDWKTDAERLASQSPDGRHAVLTALDELAERGYLSRRQERLRNGRMVTHWTLTDRPTFEPSNRRKRTTGSRFSAVGSPDVGLTAVGSADGGKPAPVLGRETELETPPPTPPAQPLDHGASADLVGVAKDVSKVRPAPSARVLLTECQRLVELGWSPEQLSTAITEHELSRARAGETELETPPPTPPAQPLDHGASADLVGVAKDVSKVRPAPSARVLLTECQRLVELGWSPEQLSTAMTEHDWSGARAGAVVAWLRACQTPPPPRRQAAPERPEWCGTCDPSSRLVLDAHGRPRRGVNCPLCHPETARRTA